MEMSSSIVAKHRDRLALEPPLELVQRHVGEPLHADPAAHSLANERRADGRARAFPHYLGQVGRAAAHGPYHQVKGLHERLVVGVDLKPVDVVLEHRHVLILPRRRLLDLNLVEYIEAQAWGGPPAASAGDDVPHHLLVGRIHRLGVRRCLLPLRVPLCQLDGLEDSVSIGRHAPHEEIVQVDLPACHGRTAESLSNCSSSRKRGRSGRIACMSEDCLPPRPCCRASAAAR